MGELAPSHESSSETVLNYVENELQVLKTERGQCCRRRREMCLRVVSISGSRDSKCDCGNSHNEVGLSCQMNTSHIESRPMKRARANSSTNSLELAASDEKDEDADGTCGSASICSVENDNNIQDCMRGKRVEALSISKPCDILMDCSVYNRELSGAVCVSPGPTLAFQDPSVFCTKSSLLGLNHHMTSLQREMLHLPLRALLARIMAHPTNRKGVFNAPVDWVTLKLMDYPNVVKEPMDLGTVKSRLWAIAYESLEAFADDVRLVFDNAMSYNPPSHPVYDAAMGLKDVFERGLKAITDGAAKGSGVSSESPNVSTVDGTEPSRSADAGPIGTLPKQRVARRHSCEACLGDTCALCLDGCLSLEPTLIICSGNGCGLKIRKGSTFYVSEDGAVFYCPRCYSNLGAVISCDDDDFSTEQDCENGQIAVRYKRDLLKRKNEEEVVESWIKCMQCAKRMHYVCAMYNPCLSEEDEFVCPLCLHGNEGDSDCDSDDELDRENEAESSYTFVSGKLHPEKMRNSNFSRLQSKFSASSLPFCSIAEFIQTKVQQRMIAEGYGNGAERTITVRVLSNIKRKFRIPSVIRRHFRTEGGDGVVPEEVKYTSRTIMMYQRIDGMDVCIYCMYVQEYDDPLLSRSKSRRSKLVKSGSPSYISSGGKRIYIAYIDSVEHFRPRECRTAVYQEVLVSYLASAKLRGFETSHIWACPPVRGNSFIFWAHPPQQRTPTRDRLLAWYHAALARSIEKGVITDVTSLYEAVFAKNLELDGSQAAICPPLLEGDFWIEHALKVHKACIARHMKSQSSVLQAMAENMDHDMEEVWKSIKNPVAQVASILERKVLPNPKSAPFRRPVNAVSLKLPDYHRVIQRPMDLGTIQGRCHMGEFDTLEDVIEEIELVFDNATRYNPVGHPVHNLALEVRDIFFREMNRLCEFWSSCTIRSSWSDDKCASRERLRSAGIECFMSMSMRLNASLEYDSVDDSVDVFDVSHEQSRKGALSCLVAAFECDSSTKPLLHMSYLGSMQDYPNVIESPSFDDDIAPRDYADDSEHNHVTQTVIETESLSLRKTEIIFEPTDKNAPSQPAAVKRACTSKKLVAARKKPRPQLNLLCDGHEAIAQRMVGEDTFLLDRNPRPAKKKSKPKSSTTSSCDSSSADNSANHATKRVSWLGEEVGSAVRKMRRDFFVCSLVPARKDALSEIEAKKADEFAVYTDMGEERITRSAARKKGVALVDGASGSSLADARHALLEFSQYRNYQFDTLRRAKYSTSMLLFYLHNPTAPGLVPVCTACDSDISNVRWHKTTGPKHAELCQDCFVKANKPREYIPLRVSFRGSQFTA